MSAVESSNRVPRRRNLAEDVAEHIRQEILAGRFRPGDRIDQDAIAVQLGVSRLPVREALISLGQEGLIESIPRRGAYVQRLEREDIADHYQLFGQVAGLAAARAVTRLDAAGLAQLIELHESMHAAADLETQQQLNHEFHRRINVAAQSQRISGMLNLLSRSLPMPYVDFPEEWLREADKQHQEVIDAFQRRDSAAAQRAMEQHISASGRHAIDVLDDMGFFAAN